MPSISQLIIHDIKVEKFLDNCSASELLEIDLLLNRPKYQDKMYPDRNADVVDPTLIGLAKPNHKP